MAELERWWMDADGDVPGVTAEQIREWERRHGVKIPKALQSALSGRDGGIMRDREVRILPLAEFLPLEVDTFDRGEFKAQGMPDPSKLFVFAVEETLGGRFLLNYHRRGWSRGPNVVLWHADGTAPEVVARSALDFLRGQFESTARPAVDWTEAESSPDVIFRETIDLTGLYKAEASMAQVLIRPGDNLIFFIHKRTPDGEELSRTVMPLPLANPLRDPIFRGIYDRGPVGKQTPCLNLETLDHDAILNKRSERDRDGRWFNVSTRGTPRYITIEASDRRSLEGLLATLGFR